MTYVEALPEEVRAKVEELLNIALHKGIVPAVKEARKERPLVLDAFHDALAEKIYQELKQEQNK